MVPLIPNIIDEEISGRIVPRTPENVVSVHMTGESRRSRRDLGLGYGYGYGMWALTQARGVGTPTIARNESDALFSVL